MGNHYLCVAGELSQPRQVGMICDFVLISAHVKLAIPGEKGLVEAFRNDFSPTGRDGGI
jgi:hypothetical protein